MYSTNKVIRTIGLVGAWAFAVTTARAVDPPPDGGYPNQNTAEGEYALFSLTTGYENTAVGFSALLSNTTGYENTAIGVSALTLNTTGAANTATGVSALTLNTTGSSNTASGFAALSNNTTGGINTASGVAALSNNVTGFSNTATGVGALFGNTSGSNNTANGVAALSSNTNGNSNTAAGDGALANSTTGSNNIALGSSAGANVITGNNNIDIGNLGAADKSNYIRIGTTGTHKRTFVAGISGATVPAGVGVIIDTNGHLGTVVFSARSKEAIKPIDKASEAILALQPVTFHYKKELDPNHIPQFGLVAEQVAKVDPDLVARDEQGKPYTVRYEAVNAMLLNEFLKEHRKVEEQTRKQQELETTVAQLQTQLQQVRNEIHATRPTPRLISASR